MLKDKTVVIGVTGSIAAYKIATLVSMLKKQNCQVHVILTKSGSEFITPLTFETLSGNKCYTDTFDRNFEFDVKHISIAKKADLIMIAPATANIMAKLAYGLADDMLTTTVLASKAPKIIAPAMNTAMFENPITQKNIDILSKTGFDIIQPETGLLACNDVGQGKMPEPEALFEHIVRVLARQKDLVGKNVLVTAGPTMESIDPVRYISNHSTGKMGFAIAKECMLRGANVTLVTGQTREIPPMFVDVINVKSAEEMYQAVMEKSSMADFVFKAAAVADYTPRETHTNKVKKKDDDLAIELTRTKDILMELGSCKGSNQVICGFSMETENLIENSMAKLKKKNADIIVANSLKEEGAGFGVDTNLVTIITKDGYVKKELMSKAMVAKLIVESAMNIKK
ncbi:MAG: bifunctional phosphopantothenoylcysteine decarboxylase/phosphopantothenate--cysteine ligase CoaBC [Anaerovoracaceae bacterium]